MKKSFVALAISWSVYVLPSYVSVVGDVRSWALEGRTDFRTFACCFGSSFVFRSPFIRCVFFGYCDQSLQLVSVCFVCFDVGWCRVCFTAFVELVLSFDLSSICWCTPRFPASAGSLLVILDDCLYCSLDVLEMV